MSSLEEEEKIDRASYGPKKEFSNLGERNSGGLYFPRSEFRLPRALRSSIPHSHPHTKLAGCHLFFLSFFLLSQPRHKRLSFDSFLCWLRLQNPTQKEKSGFPKLLGFPKHLFSFCALGQRCKRVRERGGGGGRCCGVVGRWFCRVLTCC